MSLPSVAVPSVFMRVLLSALLCLVQLCGAFAGNTNQQTGITQQNGTVQKTETEHGTNAPPEWAEAYLEDPLAETVSPSLEQLNQGLADPARALTTLQLHFPRATTLTQEEQLSFLKQALSHSQPIIRQEAALQLDRLGLLEQTIVELLRVLALDRESNRRSAGLRGLSKLGAEAIPRDLRYLYQLISALSDPDIATAEAAASQLISIGPAAVPWLIDALNTPSTQNAAAEVLGTIIRNSSQRFPQNESATRKSAIPMAAPFGAIPTSPSTIAKSRFPSAPTPSTSSQPTGESIRQVDQNAAPTTVRVYYGTNRAIELQPNLSARSIVGPATALVAIVIIAVTFIARQFGNTNSAGRHHFVRTTLIVLVVVMIAAWLVNNINQATKAQYSQRSGVQFAGHRSENSTIHYGYCDVSIPPNHEVGQVESPLFGPEDESRHVVLKEAALVEEDDYFEQLRQRLAELKDADGCFVFVHGYNVSFDNAAKRTAQIYYDLDFQGLPIFYSWPSRASIRHYFSDRNEVLFSRELIKKFLIQVAEKSGAKKINIIAHSMGADAVTQAIASIEDDTIVFDQIILAAPDIDAETFKLQLLPRMQQHGRRTTLYCSKNDLALHMSFHFNDSWRAGDSSRGLLIADGLDTVDASMIDTELLGHSYYGSCLPLLKDFRDLFLYDHPPQNRNLVSLPSLDPSTPAWTFPQFAEPTGDQPR